MDDDKRTLDGLIAQYELEPALADVYVEGQRDKAILEWFLGRHSIDQVSVYAIDLIDIPETVVANLGLNTGSNRSKVAALSVELHSHFADQIRVLCVIDRDFEDYIPMVSTASSSLCLTDGNSMETYAFNEGSLSKFTSVVLGGFPLSPRALMDCLRRVLRILYAIRLTNEKLGWGMEWLPIKKYISISGFEIEFHKDAFVLAYLQKNGRVARRGLFERKLQTYLTELPDDCTRTSRGHDLSEVMLPLINRLRKDRKFPNAAALEGALLGTLESHDLESYPLFQRILRMVAQANELPSTV